VAGAPRICRRSLTGVYVCARRRRRLTSGCGKVHHCGAPREVDTLEEWFQRAARGDRQLVFLSGEAGVGKTTVLDLWLTRLAARSTVWSGRGQCTEHYGEAEPYLSLLDALRQLGHGPQGHEILAVLQQYAPMWLTQLPDW
jgi:hypothetical protein